MAMQNYFITLLLFSFMYTADAQPKFEAQVIDNNVAIGYGLAIGDVDGDRKPDILLADKKQFVWYRNGDWKRFVMVDNLTASDNNLSRPETHARVPYIGRRNSSGY